MTCEEAERLIACERIPLEEEILLGRHVAECARCGAEETRAAVLADPVIAASADARRARARIRRAGAALAAASLILAFALALRGRRVETVYVIRGDSTGVVLTGPGVQRRSETIPPRLHRKGVRT